MYIAGPPPRRLPSGILERLREEDVEQWPVIRATGDAAEASLVPEFDQHLSRNDVGVQELAVVADVFECPREGCNHPLADVGGAGRRPSSRTSTSALPAVRTTNPSKPPSSTNTFASRSTLEPTPAKELAGPPIPNVVCGPSRTLRSTITGKNLSLQWE
jgi:hypothetical protein